MTWCAYKDTQSLKVKESNIYHSFLPKKACVAKLMTNKTDFKARSTARKDIS